MLGKPFRLGFPRPHPRTTKGSVTLWKPCKSACRHKSDVIVYFKYVQGILNDLGYVSKMYYYSIKHGAAIVGTMRVE